MTRTKLLAALLLVGTVSVAGAQQHSADTAKKAVHHHRHHKKGVTAIKGEARKEHESVGTERKEEKGKEMKVEKKMEKSESPKTEKKEMKGEMKMKKDTVIKK